jgi:hypothetical protein
MSVTARRKAFRALHLLASLVPYAEINGPFESNVVEHQVCDEQYGRSESLDPDNVGDIADEGVAHRG